ncbi:FMN-binding split barrel [Phaffia rhodozyma]|uniref:FMN-binding split barrel n=1 Tax=Phaffia rhodozyma TaxID=264483 RepID=A0A0F7SER0_PHARH|nr:FMN-binding split barrel [Phaffia rhodozyma]
MSLAASLKGLMRRVPQPVSIATVSVSHPSPHFHGATLSSLTSIALAPLPLVAFSIRLPSRLASALDPIVTPSASNPDSTTPPPDPSKLGQSPGGPMVPNPFNIHKHKLSLEGIPILQGCVGAISCRVLGSVKLSRAGLSEVGWDLGSLSRSINPEGEHELDEKLGGGEASSELYVAEVIRMEDCDGLSASSPSLSALSSSSIPASASVPSPSSSPSAAEGASEHNGSSLGLPLVYHDQRYVSVGSIGRT